jgi:hypothetical protein
MKEFFVQLISNSNRPEFPENAANHFKTRLPYPLHIRESGWTVGMVSISMPPSPPTLKLRNPLLFRMKWYVMIDPDNKVYAQEEAEMNVGDVHGCYTGTDFMNAIRTQYLHHLRDQSNPHLHFIELKTKQRMYTIMEKASDGECVLDNLNIYTVESHPEMVIGKDLALAMGWIKMGTLDNGRPGLVLGPNFRKEFPTEVVPAANDLIKNPRNNGDRIFYKIDADGLNLSCFCNWVFTDLDGAYARAFGHVRRPLYLYSNASQSTITGNQVTDLLREVPYARDILQFEPRHILYLPVRVNVMDILETQLAESSGELVNFLPGVMSVTLHFKHE